MRAVERVKVAQGSGELGGEHDDLLLWHRQRHLVHEVAVFVAPGELSLLLLEPAEVRLQRTAAAVLQDILAPCNPQPLPADKPCSILLIGVNGAGKTTTCGKLAALLRKQGSSVLLAAGDTFRAAAIEQIQAWGEKTGCDVITQQQGADSASVIYDALSSATAKKTDYLLADTSGRLHTQGNLMLELIKIKKVMQKLSPQAPTATWLVLDASLGQNSLIQAQQFHKDIGLTGLILTKLNGSAKGGCILSIARELKLPIYYIGIGEKEDDLKPFDSQQFTQMILKNQTKS